MSETDASASNPETAIAATGVKGLKKRIFMKVRERLHLWGYGVLSSQRCFSPWESNFARVAKLLPTAESTSGSFELGELGIALGMIRQLPSASWSKRQSCSGPPVKAGKTTSSAPSVAANVRSVPAMVILK